MTVTSCCHRRETLLRWYAIPLKLLITHPIRFYTWEDPPMSWTWIIPTLHLVRLRLKISACLHYPEWQNSTFAPRSTNRQCFDSAPPDRWSGWLPQTKDDILGVPQKASKSGLNICIRDLKDKSARLPEHWSFAVFWYADQFCLSTQSHPICQII